MSRKIGMGAKPKKKGSDDAALKAKITELGKANKELVAENAELKTKITELEKK